jgi:hypothetical protein
MAALFLEKDNPLIPGFSCIYFILVRFFFFTYGTGKPWEKGGERAFWKGLAHTFLIFRPAHLFDGT